MHTVLIIDDEERDIHMLRMLLEYQYGEEFRIFTASGALESLTEIHEFHPTLIFVDIQMPQMDGISFLKLLEDSQSIYAIIVSAHNDFSYVKGAMAASARDYLLKPVQLSDLNTAVSKYFLWYQKHEQEKQNRKRTDSRILHLSALLEKDIIFSVMNEKQGNYPALLDDYLLSSNIVYDWGCCTAFRIRSADGQQASVEAYEKISHLRPALRARMSKRGIRMLSAIINDTLIVYFFFHRGGRVECLEELRQITAEVSRSIGKTLGYEIQSAIGQEFASNEGFSRSFRSCMDRLRHPDNLSVTTNQEDLEQETSTSSHIVQYIRSQEPNIAREIFLSQINALSGQTQCAAFSAQTLTEIERLLFASEQKTRNCANTFRGLDKAALQQESLRQLDSLITDYVQQTRNRQHQTIVQICSYIQEKYNKQLTLSGLSHRFHINSYYLSKLFKQYTGQNFVDYLTEFRIKKAVELIENESYSVKEIAGMVGYNDQSYFSKVFKKITGSSPSEYRYRH